VPVAEQRFFARRGGEARHARLTHLPRIRRGVTRLALVRRQRRADRVAPCDMFQRAVARGERVVRVGEHAVLLDAGPFLVRDAELRERGREALRGGLAEPLERLGDVLLGPRALRGHEPEVELRRRVALRRRLPNQATAFASSLGTPSAVV
jgi:hypothetical protein